MHKSLKRFSILLAFMTLCTSSPAFADVVATAQTGENSKVSIFERLDSANYPDSYYNDEFTWSDVNQQVIDKSYPEGDPRRYTLPWGRKRKGIINGNEVGSIGLREKQLTGRDWMIVNPNYKPKQGTPLYDDEVKAFNNGNILWNKVSKAVYDKWMSFENGPGDSPFYETGEYGTIKQLSVAGKNYGEVKTKEAHKVWVTTSERPQDYKDTNGKPYEYDADTDNVFNLDKTKKTQLNALVKDPYGDNKTDYQYTRSRYQVVVRHKARGTDHHSEYYINGRSYASNDPTVPAYKFEANVTPKLNISEEYLDFKPFGKITSWNQYKDQIDPQGGWMFKTAYESWGFEDYDYTGENGYILYDFDKDTFYNHADDGTYPLAKHDAIEGANVPSSGGVVRPYEEGMFQKYDPTRNLYTQIPNPGNYKNYQLYKYFIPATTKTSNYTVNDLPSVYTKTGKYVDQKPEEDSKEWTYKERVTDVDDINNSDFTYGLFHSHKLVKGQLDSYSSSPYFGTHFNMDQTYVNARTHAIVRGYIRNSTEPALYAADNPYNNMWNNLWFTDGTFTVPRTGSARTQDIDDANFKPQFMSWDPNFEYYKALKTALLKANKITTAGKDTFTIQNPSFKTSGTATFDKNNMYTVSSKDITEPKSVWGAWKDASISVTIPSGNFYGNWSSVRSQLQNFLNSYNSLSNTSTRQYTSINNPSISTRYRYHSSSCSNHSYSVSGSTTSVVSSLINIINNHYYDYYDYPYNHNHNHNRPYDYDNYRYASIDRTTYTITYKYRDLTTTQEKVGTAYTVKLNGTLVAPGSLGDSASDYQKFLELSYNERSSNTNYVGTGAWFKAIFKEYSKAALYQDYDHKTLTSRPGEQGWVQPARDMNFQPRSHERKQYFTFDIYTRELAADGNTYYTYNTPIAMFDDNADKAIKKLDGVEVTGTKARTRSEDMFQYLFRTNFIYDALQEYMDWTPNNNFYTDKLDTKSDSDKNAVNEKYFNRYTSRTSTEKVMRDGAEVEVVKATKALSKEFSYFPYTDASNVNFTYNNNILQKYSLWLTQKGMTYEDFCKYGKDSNGKQVPISYNNKGIKIYNTEDVIFQQVPMNNHGETVQAFVPANNQTRSLYANVHFDSDEGNNVVDDEFEVWPSGIKEIKAACTAGDYANLGYVQFLNTDSKVGDTKKVSGRSYTHSTNFDPYLNGAVVYPTKNRYNGVIERPVYETQEKDIYGVIQNVEIPTVHYYTVLVNPLGYTLDTVNCAAAVQQEDIIDESHHDSLANFLNMASATFAFTDGKDTDTHVNPAWCYNVFFKVNGNAKLDYENSLGDSKIYDDTNAWNRASTGIVDTLNYYSYENVNANISNSNTNSGYDPTLTNRYVDYMYTAPNRTGDDKFNGYGDVNLILDSSNILNNTKVLNLDINGIISNPELILYNKTAAEADKVKAQSKQKRETAILDDEGVIQKSIEYGTTIQTGISSSGLNELYLKTETIKDIKAVANIRINDIYTYGGRVPVGTYKYDVSYYKPSTIYFPRLYNKDLVFEKMKINGVYDYYDTNKDPLAQTQDFENNTKNIQYMSTLPRFNNQNMTLTQATDTALALKTQIHIPNVFAGTPVMLLALPEYEQGLHRSTSGYLEIDYYVNHPDFKNITVRTDNSIEENEKFQIRTYTNADAMGVNRCMFIMPTQDINITFNSDTVDVIYTQSEKKEFVLTSLDGISNFFVDMYTIVSKGTTGLTAGFLKTTPYTLDVTDGIDLLKDEDYIIQSNNNASMKDRIFWVPSKYQYKKSETGTTAATWKKSKKAQFTEAWYNDYGKGFISDYENNSYAYVKNKLRIGHYTAFNHTYNWFDSNINNVGNYITFFDVADSSHQFREGRNFNDDVEAERFYTALYTTTDNSYDVPSFTNTEFRPIRVFSSYPGITKNTVDDYINAQFNDSTTGYMPLGKNNVIATRPTAQETLEYKGNQYWDIPKEITDIAGGKHKDVATSKKQKMEFKKLPPTDVIAKFTDADNGDNIAVKGMLVATQKNDLKTPIDSMLKAMSIRDQNLTSIVKFKPTTKTLRKKTKIGSKQTIKTYDDKGHVSGKQKLYPMYLQKLYSIKKVKFTSNLSKKNLTNWLKFGVVRDIQSESLGYDQYIIYPNVQRNSEIFTLINNMDENYITAYDRSKPDVVHLEDFRDARDRGDYRLALSYLGLPLLAIQPVTIGSVNKKLMDNIWTHVKQTNGTKKGKAVDIQLKNKIMQQRQMFSTSATETPLTDLMGLGTYMLKNGNGVAFGFGKNYSIFQTAALSTTDLYAYYRANSTIRKSTKVLLFDIFDKSDINTDTGKLKTFKERNEDYDPEDPDEPRYTYSYKAANGSKFNTILNSNSSYVAFIGTNGAKKIAKKKRDNDSIMLDHLSLYGTDDNITTDDEIDTDYLEDQEVDTGDADDAAEEASDGMTEDPDTEKQFGTKGMWKYNLYTIDGTIQTKQKQSRKYAKQVYGFPWDGKYAIGLVGSGSGSKSKPDSFIIMEPNETGQIINMYAMNSNPANPVAMVMRDDITLLKETNASVMLLKCTLQSSNYIQEMAEEYKNIVNTKYSKNSYESRKEFNEWRKESIRDTLLRSAITSEDDTTVVAPVQTANLYTNTNAAVKEIIPGFMIGSSSFNKYGITNYIYYSGNYTWEASEDTEDAGNYGDTDDVDFHYVANPSSFYSKTLKQNAKEYKKKNKVKKNKNLNSNILGKGINVNYQSVEGLENVPLDNSKLVTHGTAGVYVMRNNSKSRKSLYGISDTYKKDIDYAVLSDQKSTKTAPYLKLNKSRNNINMNGIEHMGYITAPQPVYNDEKKRFGLEVAYSGSYVIPYLNMLLVSYAYNPFFNSTSAFKCSKVDDMSEDYHTTVLLFYLMNGAPVQASDTLLQYFEATPMLCVSTPQWYALALDPGMSTYKKLGCRFSYETYDTLRRYTQMIGYAYASYDSANSLLDNVYNETNLLDNESFPEESFSDVKGFTATALRKDNTGSKIYQLGAHRYLTYARDLQIDVVDKSAKNLEVFTVLRRRILNGITDVQPFINLKSTDIDLYFTEGTLKLINKNQSETDKQYKYNTYVNNYLFSGSKDAFTPVVVYPQTVLLSTYLDQDFVHANYNILISNTDPQKNTNKRLANTTISEALIGDIDKYKVPENYNTYLEPVGELQAFISYVELKERLDVSDAPDLNKVQQILGIHATGSLRDFSWHVDWYKPYDTSSLEYYIDGIGKCSSFSEGLLLPNCGFTTELAAVNRIETNDLVNNNMNQADAMNALIKELDIWH